MRTGLTGAAVSRITRELLEAGLLQETKDSAVKGHLGRRKSSLSINANGACVLGVTITANKLIVALIDARQDVICEKSLDNLPPGEAGGAPTLNPADLVATLIAAARSLLQDNGINCQRLVGIGISVAVPSTEEISADGRVTSRVLGWDDVPVAAPFSLAFKLPVAMDSRAMSLLRAELYAGVQHNSGREATSVFLINVGLGIGTAGLVKGHVLSAGNDGSGGLSHLVFPDSSKDCYCGRTGCLEMSASGVSVVCELMSEVWNIDNPLACLSPYLDDALKRAATGDDRVRNAFFRAGEKMSSGVDTISCLINPDVIVLAGETGRQQDYFDGLRSGLEKIRSRLHPEQLELSTVRSIQGAACSALDAFVFSREIDLCDLPPYSYASDGA